MWERIKTAWKALTAKTVIFSDDKTTFCHGDSVRCCTATIKIVSYMLKVTKGIRREVLIETLKLMSLPPEKRNTFIMKKQKENMKKYK